jgi:small subunit ribosomal protein S8e
MGISKAGQFKRKATGGRRKKARHKRAYERARPSANTKMAPRRVRLVRVRGGKYKFRALRLNLGNFSWRSEQCTAKSRITNITYNAANLEYVRTNTITKNAVVVIDATPFRLWYKKTYNVDLSKGTFHVLKDDPKLSDEKKEEVRKQREKMVEVPENLLNYFKSGKLLACVSSKPGQVGRADGYLLEGEELDFYQKAIAARKKKHQK